MQKMGDVPEVQALMAEVDRLLQLQWVERAAHAAAIRQRGLAA